VNNVANLTWLGHGSFRVDSVAGKRVYVDPWLKGNPACPETEWEPERVDVIAVTHGHFDHVGDVVALADRFAPVTLAQYEVAEWLKTQGVDIPDDRPGMGKGGTVKVDGLAFTMTHAVHSSGIVTDAGMVYGGEAAGYVLTLEDGQALYFAGDTTVFSDMALIGELYQPDVAILPIGDYLTMGPREAALALSLLGAQRCVPGHFGTIPILTGTPDELRRLAPDVDVLDLMPGVPFEL
jgi:L-ascorbate metabolism protein UlaG (beta-lactamase superfamily)